MFRNLILYKQSFCTGLADVFCAPAEQKKPSVLCLFKIKTSCVSTLFWHMFVVCHYFLQSNRIR